MDCDTSRRLLRIKLDRHRCSDNGLGSEHNEANHFGPLSNAFHPSISLFCKILKMQMIQKKITIKSQHMARKNQALLSQFATLKLTSTNASVRYGHRGLPLTVPTAKLAFIVVSLPVRSTDFPGLPQSLSTINQTDTFRDSSPSSALFSLGTFDTVTGI